MMMIYHFFIIHIIILIFITLSQTINLRLFKTYSLYTTIHNLMKVVEARFPDGVENVVGKEKLLVVCV